MTTGAGVSAWATRIFDWPCGSFSQSSMKRRAEAVPLGEGHQGLGAVVEVLAQHLVLGALGAVEGEVEEAVRGRTRPTWARHSSITSIGEWEKTLCACTTSKWSLGQEVQGEVAR